MGESRLELLAWMSDLLQMEFTKIEQCGTGAPLCQIFDSIYGDVPMSKVKFDVHSEYQYLPNFKVLQAVFLRHKIDKTVPVERLVKCKMQDNLEFLQWVKKFWDAHYPGGEYDALSRRKGPGISSAASSGAAPRAASVVSSRKVSGTSSTGAGSSGASNGSGIVPRTRTPSANVQIQQLQTENAALREHAEGLERERDFYFSKLRDIEIYVTSVADEDAALVGADGVPANAEKDAMIRQIQDILYTTEEGFEIPDAEAVDAVEEEETF